MGFGLRRKAKRNFLLRKTGKGFFQTRTVKVEKNLAVGGKGAGQFHFGSRLIFQGTEKRQVLGVESGQNGEARFDQATKGGDFTPLIGAHFHQVNLMGGIKFF